MNMTKNSALIIKESTIRKYLLIKELNEVDNAYAQIPRADRAGNQLSPNRGFFGKIF